MKKEFPNIENCNPRTCLSGQVMKCNRIIGNIFRKHLKPFGITDSQLSILFVVTKARDVNQKKLSDVLFMEKSTVNRNITRLINSGYINYSNKILEITATGKEFLEKVLPHWEMAMNEMREVLTTDGVNALLFVTKQLEKQ